MLRRPYLQGRLVEELPMAQNKVIQWVCDRCEAQELRPDTTSANTDGAADLYLVFNGQTTRWSDLCDSCKKTVSNYVANILKAKKKGSEEEPISPSISAPRGSAT